MRRLIQNGICFVDGKWFERANIVLEDGRITGVFREKDMSGCSDKAENESLYDEIIDAEGCFVVPGFVDVHLHGAAGYDFCTASMEELEEILSFESSSGVTGICPTTMTLPVEELEEIISRLGAFAALHPDAVLGLHMEGPFLSPKKAGAQSAKNIISADSAAMQKWYETSGERIRLVTIAPENADPDFISEWKDKVHISVGHTAADYEQTSLAFASGADHVTHLYNGMTVPTHREPGVKGAAFDAKQVYVELICDLQHVHPSAVRETFAQFGEDRVVMISDSCEAAGMPDGEYALGGQAVFKKGQTARLADGTLAGSVSTLYDCFRRALDIGIAAETALKACTCNPAASIGLKGKTGILQEGAFGKVLVTDQDWKLVRVL